MKNGVRPCQTLRSTFNIFKFISLTDSDQIIIRNRTTDNEDYKRGIAHLKNFYVVADDMRKGLVRLLRDSGELGECLLLNMKTRRFGVKEFNIPTKLTPKASSEAIAKLIECFNDAYLKRN